MYFVTNPPRGDDLMLGLEEWVANNPTTRLIVVDTLMKACPGQSRKSFADLCEFARRLQRFALEHHVAILATAHECKWVGDRIDRLEDTELATAADTVMVVERERGCEYGHLTVTSRDFQGYVINNLRFHEGRWELAVG
jgi:hypothetical protein